MMVSPRVAQFDVPLSDKALDALIAVPVQSVAVSGGDAAADAKLIGDALRRMFVPDKQSRRILRFFLALCRAHAKHHFESDEEFLTGLYSKYPWGFGRSPAICFTGHAGTGKSQILLALARLFSRSRSFSVEGHRNLPLVAAWPMTLAKGDGLNQLLRDHVEQLEPDNSGYDQSQESEPEVTKDWNTAALLKAAARVSWKNACCVMPVDEFQWIAASSTANARASTILLKLHGIGPMLLFCANFSLIHKLKSRPPEDRDRLLPCPIVLKPLAADDADWIAYLEAMRGVAPELLTFVPARDAQIIHQYTYGIKRKAVDLVEVAVRMARRKSDTATVGSDWLLAAYRSAEYAMHRDDVDALVRQDITGKVERRDLSCPFDSTEVSAGNVTAVPSAVESFERRVEDAILADALMPSEAAALAQISTEDAPKVSAGKVLRFNSRKVTKDDLLKGAAALDALK